MFENWALKRFFGPKQHKVEKVIMRSLMICTAVTNPTWIGLGSNSDFQVENDKYLL